MPRTSNLIAENKMDEFKVLIQKSYDFILALATPLTVGLSRRNKGISVCTLVTVKQMTSVPWKKYVNL